MSNQLKENKMGTMPIGPLVLNMSLPMMFSMLIQALYNIVDSVFVSMINEEALTSVSLAFPFQTLMISVSIGTSVGVNALLSMRLGQKDQEAVNSTAMNGIFLSIMSFIGFFVIALIAINPYLKSQTQNPIIIEYGKTYLDIVMFYSLGMFLGCMFDKLLQSTGKTVYTMFTQLLGAITNIILDPVLIFGLGPFPKMGIAGAAFATVIGQFLGMFLSVYFNRAFNHEIQFRFRNLKHFRPNKVVIGQIYKVGVPTIIMQAVGSVTTYGMNLVLGAFKGISDTAIAVYGSYFKLNSFIFMPVFGLNNGTVPIISYNYGAQNRKRIRSTIKVSIMFAVVIMAIGTVLFECIPESLLGFFNASDNMLAIGVPALRIIATSFMGAAIAISLGTVFQALGNAIYSMIVSIARQIIVLLPSAYLLSLTGNINAVWWCFPIAEIMSLVISGIFFIRIYRAKIKDI